MRLHNRKTITLPKDKETLLREALTREEAVRLHRIAEASIVEEWHAPSQPLPTFYPSTTPRFSILQAIIHECANLIKI